VSVFFFFFFFYTYSVEINCYSQFQYNKSIIFALFLVVWAILTAKSMNFKTLHCMDKAIHFSKCLLFHWKNEKKRVIHVWTNDIWRMNDDIFIPSKSFGTEG